MTTTYDHAARITFADRQTALLAFCAAAAIGGAPAPAAIATALRSGASEADAIAYALAGEAAAAADDLDAEREVWGWTQPDATPGGRWAWSGRGRSSVTLEGTTLHITAPRAENAADAEDAIFGRLAAVARAGLTSWGAVGGVMEGWRRRQERRDAQIAQDAQDARERAIEAERRERCSLALRRKLGGYTPWQALP